MAFVAVFFFIIIMIVKMSSESHRFSRMKQEFHDFKNDFSSQLSQLPKSFLKSLTGHIYKCCGESEGEIKANVNAIVTESLERLKY